MLSKLDQLLADIDPSGTWAELERDLDRALASFPIPQNPFTDIDTFEDFMARFYRHLQNIYCGINPPIKKPTRLDKEYCAKFLSQAYQGSYTAYENANGGFEGGLYQVMKTIGRLWIDFNVNSWTEDKVNEFLQGLSYDAKKMYAQEYAARFHHFLPAAMTKDNAWFVFVKLRQVLLQHPRMIKRLHQLGG